MGGDALNRLCLTASSGESITVTSGTRAGRHSPIVQNAVALVECTVARRWFCCIWGGVG